MSLKNLNMEAFVNYFLEIEKKKLAKLVCLRCCGPVKQLLNKNSYRCTRNGCRKQSVFHENIVFKNSKIEIVSVLKLIFLWCNNTKIKTICDIIGLSKLSIRRILKKFWIVLDNMKNQYCYKIGGDGIIIEVDESKFGKRKYNKGHKVDGVWIIGCVERSEKKRIILEAIKKRDCISIDTFFKKYVEKKSTVYSDCWKGYNNLKEIDYNHLTVNHSKNFKDPITGVHTNTIEGNWNGIKQQVPPRCRTEKKIQNYLNLFMLKRNCNNDYLITIIEELINK